MTLGLRKQSDWWNDRVILRLKRKYWQRWNWRVLWRLTVPFPLWLGIKNAYNSIKAVSRSSFQWMWRLLRAEIYSKFVNEAVWNVILNSAFAFPQKTHFNFYNWRVLQCTIKLPFLLATVLEICMGWFSYDDNLTEIFLM